MKKVEFTQNPAQALRKLHLARNKAAVRMGTGLILTVSICCNPVLGFPLILTVGQNAFRSAKAATTDQSEETFKRGNTYVVVNSEDKETLLGVTKYEGSKGSWVTVTSGHYSSWEAAGSSLTKEVEQTTIVLERRSLTDSTGLPVGQRVVALFPGVQVCLECTEILWAYESEYYRVAASSMQVALKFEQRILAHRKLDSCSSRFFHECQ